MYATSIGSSQIGEIYFSIEENRTQKVILEYLRQWLPQFSEWAGNYHKQTNYKNENSISESLEHFMQIKLKKTNLVISFNRIKGVDFRFKFDNSNIGSPPIFLIEAKRLPPTSSHDYIHHPNKSGGISRFKLEQSGFDYDLNVGAMFGYIQKNDFEHWHRKVNSWVDGLIKQPKDRITWAECDKLYNIATNNNLAEYASIHSRITKGNIKLYHFWFKV